MFFLSLVVLGIVAGWLTGRILKGNQYGPFVDIVMGIAGSLAGGFLMTRFAGFSGRGGTFYAAFVALLGAVLMTVLTAFINGRKRYA
jgi:uncharacterized membrane protein YeaQ/YmgE (transglycosylase-associated protein family)